MIEPLKPKQSLRAAELQDGDIICFQRVQEKKNNILEKKLSFGDKQADDRLACTGRFAPRRAAPANSSRSAKRSDRCEDAREYYDFLFHKRTLLFHPHPHKCDRTKYGQFEVVISCKASYDQFAEKVGEKLGVEPTHLRFYTVNAATGNVKTPIKRGANTQLNAILNPTSSYAQLNTNQRSDAFYYEVLDMTLAELDTKKNIKVNWITEGITKDELIEVLVPKNGVIEDLIAGLIKKAQIPSEEEGGRIRVLEVSHHKITKEFSRDYPVISINDYVDIVAERIPPDEIGVDPSMFINCFHFASEASRMHGVPFRFLLKEVCTKGEGNARGGIKSGANKYHAARALLRDKGPPREEDGHQGAQLREDQVCRDSQIDVSQDDVSERW